MAYIEAKLCVTELKMMTRFHFIEILMILTKYVFDVSVWLTKYMYSVTVEFRNSEVLLYTPEQKAMIQRGAAEHVVANLCIPTALYWW